MNNLFKNNKEIKEYLNDLEKAIENNQKFYWQEDMDVLIDLVRKYITKEEKAKKEEFDDWLINREDSIGE
jgi:hypothetical protein